MAEKKKSEGKMADSAPDEKPAAALEVPETPAPLPVDAPAPKPTVAPVASAHSGFLGRAKPTRAHLASLASASGTSPLVLAALKAAYGWTERTKLTRPEFLRRRDEWLARPASEV